MCWPKGESGKLWLKRPKMAFQAKISFLVSLLFDDGGAVQGGITCGAIDEPRKSSKAIDERVIINFRDKNVVIARFATKMS